MTQSLSIPYFSIELTKTIEVYMELLVPRDGEIHTHKTEIHWMNFYSLFYAPTTFWQRFFHWSQNAVT